MSGKSKGVTPITVSPETIRHVENRLHDFFSVYGFVEAPKGLPFALAPLERALISEPELPGIFCLSGEYENGLDPNFGAGVSSATLKFEGRGNPQNLRDFLPDILDHLGIDTTRNPGYGTTKGLDRGYYHHILHCFPNGIDDVAVSKICNNWAQAFIVFGYPLLPEIPCWNIMHNEGSISLFDLLLLGGGKTIRVAQRSCDPQLMHEDFKRAIVSSHANHFFGEKRSCVLTEIDHFLSLPLCPRFGGCIAVERLAIALQMSGLIPKETNETGSRSHAEAETAVRPRQNPIPA